MAELGLIWDHHGERRTEASNMEGTDAQEYDDAQLVMMRDGTRDDVADGGGGEGCGGEDDGEDNEEDEEDFLDHHLCHKSDTATTATNGS